MALRKKKEDNGLRAGGRRHLGVAQRRGLGWFVQ